MPIFDQGYQHWNGPLSGHTWRWVAVARHGIRATMKIRGIRVLMFAAWIPAIALVAFLAVWGLLEQQVESVLSFLGGMGLPAELISRPQGFRGPIWTIAFSFFFKAELAAALFLVLIVGPNLVSRDLRFNALPLYFSRPMRRIDYFLGKLGVIAFFLAATAILPAVAAYVVGLGFSLDVSVIKDTHRLLWAGTLYGLIITVSAGTLMLALSSLSRRSIYVGLAWAGFVFLTLTLSWILIGIRFETEQHQIVQGGLRDWVERRPPPAGVSMNGSRPLHSFTPTPGGRGGGKLGPVRDQTAHPEPFTPTEIAAAQRWYDEWTRERNDLRAKAEAASAEGNRTDWRPVISYSNNLGRLGDWLLDTDSAWVAILRPFEQQRAAIAPLVSLQTGGRAPGALTGSANERRAADMMVWQFPWYWAAGALGGLWLVSVFILTRRVKSLDRLK